MAELAEKNELKSPNFSSTRNACKLCSPLGVSLVFRGIENCIPLVHGSQGCSTYIRRYIISHFKEPIDIASSNFSEASAIFGGGLNLKTAIENVVRQYAPDVVGVATTCLSETIGDDVKMHLNEYKKENPKSDVTIVHASTPSYAGTHMDGYHAAVRAVVAELSLGGTPDGSVNLVPGFLSAEDLRHLKEILSSFGVKYTMLPDYSETLDGESWDQYQALPKGGTKLYEIKRMGRAEGTIMFGRSVPDAKSAGVYLEQNFGVKNYKLGMPFGIHETDEFFSALEEITGVRTPDRYVSERGRLVDSYIDGHKYVFGKRAVIYGEEDFCAGIAALLDEIGMQTVLCASGAKSSSLKNEIERVAPNSRDVIVADDTDFATMLDICRENKADIIIGSSKGYYLAKNLKLPLLRAGFPVHDRIGGQRILHVSYRGAQSLYDKIVNALIEQKQMGNAIGYSYI